MTFKDLQKKVSLETTTKQQYRLTKGVHDKPFWIWNIAEHKQEDFKTDGDCCFNNIIGLPTNEGEEKAIFDYERILYDALLDNDDSIHAFKHKHLCNACPQKTDTAS